MWPPVNRTTVVLVTVLVVFPGAAFGIQAAPVFPAEESLDIQFEAVDGDSPYVDVADTGGNELSISIGGPETDTPGVNVNALTQTGPLVSVTNVDTDGQPAELVVEGGSDQLQLVTDEGSVIPTNTSGNDAGLNLSVGEEVSVGVTVDTTTGDVEAGDTIEETLTITAQVPDENDSDESESGDGSGDGGDGGNSSDDGSDSGGEDGSQDGDEGNDSDGPTPPEESPDEPVVTDGDGDDATTDTVETTTTELSPDDIDDPDRTEAVAGAGTDSETTTASADGAAVSTAVDGAVAADSPAEIATAAAGTAEAGDATLGGAETNAAVITNIGLDRAQLGEFSETGSEREISDNAVFTITGLTTTLDGSRSVISPMAAISDREPLTAYDIEPAESVEGSATVTMPVGAAELEGASPDDLVIGRLTETGWQLLETAASRADGTVSVTAKTPGFSVFAVFAAPDVGYEWTFPDGTTKSGVSVDHSFDEPGIYDVELTVTNALGRSSTSTVQYVADDLPTVQPEIVDAGDDNRTTLAATVNNDLGETTVTWVLPDGTELTGTEVAAALPPGDNTVTVRVEDSFGLRSESEVVVSVNEPETVLEQVSQDPIVPLTALSSLVLFGTIRGYRRGSLQPVIEQLKRGPEIRSLGSPVVDAARARVGVTELSVRDSYQLTTVDVRLQTADGGVVVHKEISLDTQASQIMSSYEASPEWITLPPRVDLDPDAEYVLEVVVEDDAGHSTTDRTRSFVVTGADENSPTETGLL